MTTAKELYNEVYKTVFKHGNNSEEYDRVFDEVTLIGTRGWEPFILLLSEVITQKRDMPVELSGSALDSCLLCLATTSVIGDAGREDDGKLKNPKSLDSLFDDALRLNIDIVSALSDVVDSEVSEILDCIRSTAKLLNLTIHSIDETGLWLAIGKGKEISDSDVEILKNEKPESTKKEAEILHKYLLIRISRR